MTPDLLVRYLHFLGIIGISGALVSEHLLIAKELTPAQIRRLSIVDAIYGVCAILTIGAGLALWLAVGKPPETYTKNPVLHVKLTLFVVMWLVSLHPTLWFRKNRKSAEATVALPRSVNMALRFQLLLLLVIPLLGVLLAAGVGLPTE